MEKIWGILVHLSYNMWKKKFEILEFEDETWDKILIACKDAGFNTVLLDVGDGVVFSKHPELAIENSWTRERVHTEIEKARKMGIKIFPKVNFSTTHDYWLGEYERMISTKIYYEVCSDIISEIYDIFEEPEYIHLGMDEENIQFFGISEITVCRHGELLWHDLRYLCDCVKQTGATPWIWSDYLFDNPEEFRKRFEVDELILSPWYYHALREEHFTPIKGDPKLEKYYSEGVYKNTNLTYVEDDIFHSKFRREALPNAEHGYRYVPTASTYDGCKYNTDELVEYFKIKAPDSSVLGFLTAPWWPTTREYLDSIYDSINLLKKAREQYYPQEK